MTPFDQIPIKLFIVAIVATITDFLVERIKENNDFLMVSETKLDKRFLQVQFKIAGFSTSFRLDCYSNGGVLFYFLAKIFKLSKIHLYTGFM